MYLRVPRAAVLPCLPGRRLACFSSPKMIVRYREAILCNRRGLGEGDSAGDTPSLRDSDAAWVGRLSPR